MNIRSLAASAFIAIGLAAPVSAATFTALDATEFDLTCSSCTLQAFLEDNGTTIGGLSGVLDTDDGTAFNPVTGAPASRDPSLAGEAEEIAFLTDVAALFGDTYVGGSFDKVEDGTTEIEVTDGDYILWKSGQYAGVAKVTNVGEGNMFMYVGTPALSHFSKIDTTTTPVPLPAAGWMLIAGVGGLAAMRRRKKS